MSAIPAAQRATILLEDAKVVSNTAHPGAQYVLRLSAPEIAACARPGTFVHLRCSPARPLRRPLSIMLTDPARGMLDLLFKVCGAGTAELAARRPGERLSVMGPIGVPFKLDGYRRRPLLIGGGVGIPPLIHLAAHLREHKDLSAFAALGSEVPFPFRAQPSRVLVPGMPDGTIAMHPLLEGWGIVNRLATRQGYVGCFDGHVTELAERWLEALDQSGRAEVEIFACGPTPMLRAVQKLALRYRLPAQLALEEYMACGVGGCAGCAVRVRLPTGPAMQRVCVDGPVFDAAIVEFGP